MRTEQALYQAILDNPADDLPRLVFADWLEEHGGQKGFVRAEFIRDSVRLFPVLPRTNIGTDGNLFAMLPVEERALANHGHGLCWHRGFLGQMAKPSGWWLEYGAWAIRQFPIELPCTTDKRPAWNRLGWFWNGHAPGDPHYRLPDQWYTRLKRPPDERNVCLYSDQMAAIADLSQAILAHARSDQPVISPPGW